MGLQVREGLLFVWPSSGPEAFIHSAAVQPAGSQVFAQVSPGTAHLALQLPVHLLRQPHYPNMLNRQVTSNQTVNDDY